MNVLIYFIIAFIASVTALNDIEPESTPPSNVIHSRFEIGHILNISSARNDDERTAIQNVIEQWHSLGAMDRDPGEIFHYVSGSSRALFELVGTYFVNEDEYECFAIQIDARTFSAVHIQRGVTFEVELIRSAFEESRDLLADVFLSEDNIPINESNDST